MVKRVRIALMVEGVEWLSQRWLRGVEEVVRCNELRKQDFRCFDE